MKKKLAYYLDLPYSVRVKKTAEDCYFAEIEELPGCITEADSFEEVMQMIEDAKRAWLEVALETKRAIPEPVDTNYSGKLNIRLPKSVHRHIAYRAKAEGVSLNTYISNTLSSTLGS